MKNTIGTLVWLLLFTTSNAVYYDNARDYSYSSLLSQQKSAWRLLEELIIKQPQKNVNTLLGKKGATLLTSGGVGILGYCATKSLSGRSSISKACSLGTGLVTSLLTYHGIKNYLLEQEEHRQVTKIMKLWPQAKEKMPQEVQKALEELHTTWESDPDNYDEQVESVLTFLKVELYGRYPHKYRNEPESFFTSRNLHVRLHLDLYKTAETLLSLGRHVLEGL